jgi:hypothetical protein
VLKCDQVIGRLLDEFAAFNQELFKEIVHLYSGR